MIAMRICKRMFKKIKMELEDEEGVEVDGDDINAINEEIEAMNELLNNGVAVYHFNFKMFDLIPMGDMTIVIKKENKKEEKEKSGNTQ